MVRRGFAAPLAPTLYGGVDPLLGGTRAEIERFETARISLGWAPYALPAGVP